jgi:hypothetical protein
MKNGITELTVMAAKSFTRKADGSRFHRFTGIVDDKRSAQIILDGAAADSLADVMVPVAAQSGAYISLVFAEGFVTDANPETYTNDSGNVVTSLFADRPVYNIRCAKDGAMWTIGEAVVRPTPKAALSSDEMTDAVTKALNNLKRG